MLERRGNEKTKGDKGEGKVWVSLFRKRRIVLEQIYGKFGKNSVVFREA